MRRSPSAAGEQRHPSRRRLKNQFPGSSTFDLSEGGPLQFRKVTIPQLLVSVLYLFFVPDGSRPFASSNLLCFRNVLLKTGNEARRKLMKYFIIGHCRCTTIHSTVLIKDNKLQRRSRGYTSLAFARALFRQQHTTTGVCCVAARTARSTKSQLELDDPTLRLDLLLPVGVLLPLPGRDLLLQRRDALRVC